MAKIQKDVKNLLTIIFIILSFRCVAEIPEPVKAIGLYTISIALDAVGDGLYDEGSKTWGHALNAASTALLLVSPVVLDFDGDDWWAYVLTYVTLRVALFDYTYNVTRGLPLSYTGTTSISDKAWNQIAPPGHRWVPRGMCLILSIHIPITYFN